MAALQVFLTTAISQNGSLDAFAVLVAQSRLVLQIARIYNQRPSVRDLVWLYGNVAMAALLARQIEDLDVAETIQPLVSSVMSSALGAVPGMEAAANVFVQSVLSGSANAYVTLRVGVLAKRYCGSLTMPDAGTARKAAFAEAMQMIPSVVHQGGRTVANIIKTAMTKTVVDSVRRAGSATVATAGNVTRQIAHGAREVAASGISSVLKWTDRLPFLRRTAGDAAAKEHAEKTPDAERLDKEVGGEAVSGPGADAASSIAPTVNDDGLEVAGTDSAAEGQHMQDGTVQGVSGR